MRKHLIDKGLIDAAAYKVNISPLDVSELVCVAIIENDIQDTLRNLLNTEYRQKPSERVIECMDFSMRNLNYTEAINKVIILSRLKLSDEDKAAEKLRFAKLFVKVYKANKKCQEV